MRILSRHLTPLDRQVRESLNITKASACPDECLNLKSEWGGSKLPDLQIQTPKGVAKVRDPRKEAEMSQDIENQGERRVLDHRIPQREVPGQRPYKRQRETSPEEKGQEKEQGWKERPTFKQEIAK